MEKFFMENNKLESGLESVPILLDTVPTNTTQTQGNRYFHFTFTE